MRSKTWQWLSPVLGFSSRNAHLVVHGTDPVVVFENVKSCRSSVCRSVLLQEGLCVFAVLSMVTTDERIGHYGGDN